MIHPKVRKLLRTAEWVAVIDPKDDDRLPDPAARAETTAGPPAPA